VPVKQLHDSIYTVKGEHLTLRAFMPRRNVYNALLVALESQMKKPLLTRR